VKRLKVGIVGAEAARWKEEQIPKVKDAIYDILQGLPIEVLDNRVGGNYEIAKLWTEGREREELIFVSGHCPVGRERPYCTDCHEWVDDVNLHSAWHQWGFTEENRIIKVYDQGGVDTWAEIIATEFGIQKEIYPAEVYQWFDKVLPTDVIRFGTKKHALLGFRSRNIQIAEAIPLPPDGVLYDIEPKIACKFCKGSGKFVELIDGSFRCPQCNGTGKVINRSGGTWTMEYAKKLRKEVHQIVIG